jgi:hypothetical protein
METLTLIGASYFVLFACVEGALHVELVGRGGSYKCAKLWLEQFIDRITCDTGVDGRIILKLIL